MNEKWFANNIVIKKAEFNLLVKPKWYQFRMRRNARKLKKSEDKFNEKGIDELYDSIKKYVINE